MTAQTAARARWQPSSLVLGSVGLHIGAAAALVIAPGQWPSAAGTIIANHLLITAAGLWPRSRLLGPNLLRLPPSAAQRNEIALTIDDGPEPEITPRVLDLLDAYRARATFFCIGEVALRHRDLCAEIARRGHAVENHSQRHRHSFSLSGLGGFEREIAAAQETLAAITGVVPAFFRAPAGLRNPFLDPILFKLGLRLATWTRRGFDTVTRDPDVVTARLLRKLAPADILLLHDGHAARAATGAPVILEVLPRVLDACAARGLHSVTLREGTA
ncbi:MAG: polysaccharide deacetylase family protein [Casimicrobiaceae bacterium]